MEICSFHRNSETGNFHDHCKKWDSSNFAWNCWGEGNFLKLNSGSPVGPASQPIGGGTAGTTGMKGSSQDSSHPLLPATDWLRMLPFVCPPRQSAARGATWRAVLRESVVRGGATLKAALSGSQQWGAGLLGSLSQSAAGRGKLSMKRPWTWRWALQAACYFYFASMRFK